MPYLRIYSTVLQIGIFKHLTVDDKAKMALISNLDYESFPDTTAIISPSGGTEKQSCTVSRISKIIK
jgi:hypothetical protein